MNGDNLNSQMPYQRYHLKKDNQTVNQLNNRPKIITWHYDTLSCTLCIYSSVGLAKRIRNVKI